MLFGFENRADIINHFCDSEDDNILPPNSHVLLAYYSYEDYSGEAFVLFVQDNKLYETWGSHCSCHGLEGQWNPEETSIEALAHRMREGNLLMCDDYRNITARKEAKEHLEFLIATFKDLPQEDAAERISFLCELSKIKGR